MSRDQDHGPHPAAEDRYELPPGRAYDPSAGSSAAEAWAREQYASGDPYAIGDPYAASPHGSDPYATDPLSADGFGPSSSSSAAPSGRPGDPYRGPSFGGAEGHETSGYGAPGYGVPGYGMPGYGDPGYGAVRPSSGSAIAGFVLGLLAVAMCGGLTSPVGIFLSARGLQETGPAAAPPRDGRGLAIAGMVLSVVGLIPLLALLAYLLLILVAVLAGTTG